MRRTEGWTEYRVPVQCPRERVNGRHFYHFFFRKVGKDRHGRTGKQSLACTGRAVQGYVVSAGRRDDESALRTLLSAYFVERFVVVLMRGTHSRSNGPL